MKHSSDYPLETRPVMGFDDSYPAGFVDPPHAHQRAQLTYCEKGVMTVISAANSFILPPRRAIWLPAGTVHEVHCRNAVASYTLYIDPALDTSAQQARVFEVSDLVRALIFEVGHFHPDYDLEGRDGEIARLLLSEIRRMPLLPSALAMPSDPRLLRVCRTLVDNPADQRDIDGWAALAAMGRRTFTRAFREETGAGLATWRQQVRLMAAISRLAEGQPVTTVAYDVGYESPSAFSAVFHRIFGMAPSAFIGLAPGQD
ncbi:helix-turn-helix domain-containing protein [Novosphingobium tardum]|uniref:Helix-turn-helix domain-containing protein n=1 Tax=Novosphingobium tardum TaxID=1538021 RepID=A0ABV8RSV0_9SPHN